MHLENIAFLTLFITATALFVMKIREIRANINMGHDLDRSDNASERWKTMALVAIGQKKMITRPLAGLLHIVVYAGFIIINIEMLEIFTDGIFGTHRAFSGLGGFYNFLIASFEVLAFLVLVACVVFLLRRNVAKVKRFHYREMTSFPKSDANLILISEVLMMSAFLIMNACDLILQERGVEHFHTAGAFPISTFLVPMLDGMGDGGLILIERACWWFHIFGVFALLNYLPYSKHFHIVLAFPNVFFSNLRPKGQFNNLEAVTKEVKLMFDPNADPYAAPADGGGEVKRFGAKDVTDLTWKQLLDAYTCTECGRCSSSCPANQTGKLLSPRKIMMDTRDRMEEIGRNCKKHGKDYTDNKSLLGDYISAEEVWACTSCNACVEECPVNIDPLSIIIDLRRYLVMEESKAPTELTGMFTNIENNGAPWQFSPADRLNWANEA